MLNKKCGVSLTVPNLVWCSVRGCVLNEKCGVSLTVPNLVSCCVQHDRL